VKRRAALALSGLALLPLAGALSLVASASGAREHNARATTAKPKPFKLPKVAHVFVIVLENEDYATTFGEPAADPYLAHTLPSQGALLSEYFATGHESNDNYISLVSGQPPNPENQADCQIYSNFLAPVTLTNGVVSGVGCVYPASVANIGTQLTGAGKSWKAYEQDMGNDPNRESAACGHPALESKDETQEAVEGDGYATRHDPFVYFHSVIDDQEYCDQHVVALGGPEGTMPADALHGETGLASRRPRRPTSRSSPPTCATTDTTSRARTSRAAPPRWPTSTRSWKRGCRRSPPRRPSARTAFC
jgi:hypothetical protein